MPLPTPLADYFSSSMVSFSSLVLLHFTLIHQIKQLYTFPFIFSVSSLHYSKGKVDAILSDPTFNGHVRIKNERVYRLISDWIRYQSLIILLLSVASMRKKKVKTTHIEERKTLTNPRSHSDRKYFN